MALGSDPVNTIVGSSGANGADSADPKFSGQDGGGGEEATNVVSGLTESAPTTSTVNVGAQGGNGGAGGRGADGAPATNQLDVFSGSAGGAGGSGGDALAELTNASLLDVSSITASATGGGASQQAGAGGDGGNGNDGLSPDGIYNGGRGGDGGKAGAGGGALATVSGSTFALDDQFASASLGIQAAAYGGAGGMGGTAGSGGDDVSAGGTGAVGGMGASASAAVTGNTVINTGAFNRQFVILDAYAASGNGGNGGNGGEDFVDDAAIQSQSLPGAAAGAGGDGGIANASVSNNTVDSASSGIGTVLLDVSATVGQGGIGGYSGSTENLATAQGSSGEQANSGLIGAASLSITDNHIDFIGGKVALSAIATPVFASQFLAFDLSPANFTFSGNSFIDGGNGVLDLSAVFYAGSTINVANGTLSIAGSPASNTFSGFDDFLGSQGMTTFIDGPGNQTYEASETPHYDFTPIQVTFSPGHGADTVNYFEAGDTIAFDGFGAGFQSFAAVQAATTDTAFGRLISTPDGGTVQVNIAGTADLTADEFTFSDAAFCFCPGTLIRSARGDIPVEQLTIGDRVATVHGGAQPIQWIGRSRYDGRLLGSNPLMLPVCIKSGALGPNSPCRDLHVSPGHGVYLEGVLVPAWRLVNGVTIIQAASVTEVSYIHIELPEHELIFAEGTAVETFLDGDGRGQFQNAPEYHRLYPTPRAQAIACVPRVESGFLLRAIQQRLHYPSGVVPQSFAPGMLRGYVDTAGPACISGWAQDASDPEDPVCLDVFMDGRRVARVLANAYRFDLRRSGFGSGCHGFQASLPDRTFARIEVRRAIDSALLPHTLAASERLAIAAAA